jgi:hypothetical protein
MPTPRADPRFSFQTLFAGLQPGGQFPLDLNVQHGFIHNLIVCHLGQNG